MTEVFTSTASNFMPFSESNQQETIIGNPAI